MVMREIKENTKEKYAYLFFSYVKQKIHKILEFYLKISYYNIFYFINYFLCNLGSSI